jgi:hypothetical protein
MNPKLSGPGALEHHTIHPVTHLDGANHPLCQLQCSCHIILIFIVKIMQNTHDENKQNQRFQTTFHVTMQQGGPAKQPPSKTQLPGSHAWL